MRDAELFKTPARRDWAVHPARHSGVWVRAAGQWREGHILHWMHLRDGRWVVFTSYKHPEGWAYPAYDHFVYDPDTIRPRTGHTPPAD